MYPLTSHPSTRGIAAAIDATERQLGEVLHKQARAQWPPEQKLMLRAEICRFPLHTIGAAMGIGAAQHACAMPCTPSEQLVWLHVIGNNPQTSKLRFSLGCCERQHRGPTQARFRCDAERLDLAAPGPSCDLPCEGHVVILSCRFSSTRRNRLRLAGARELRSWMRSITPRKRITLYPRLCQHVGSVLFPIFGACYAPKPRQGFRRRAFRHLPKNPRWWRYPENLARVVSNEVPGIWLRQLPQAGIRMNQLLEIAGLSGEVGPKPSRINEPWKDGPTGSNPSSGTWL
ncbi:hypothetical protein B0I37DRAFT_180145 [Chaetomium sp. MPI-CAGE-AT-0009]|nr:hypothetical protein B0I37DRAFT_180145 [Chaetomium sp. MPI-CAGE-AT-0009]